MKQRSFWLVFAALVAVLAFLGIKRFSTWNPQQASAGVPCINPALPIPNELHIHPHLTIMANGQQVTVPANLGLSATCERALHTHDTSGTIHVEPNFARDFSLGDFFSVWGQPLSSSQVLDYKVDADHQLTMTVDGQASLEFDKLVLKDKQEIVLTYDAKTAATTVYRDTAHKYEVVIPSDWMVESNGTLFLSPAFKQSLAKNKIACSDNDEATDCLSEAQPANFVFATTAIPSDAENKKDVTLNGVAFTQYEAVSPWGETHYHTVKNGVQYDFALYADAAGQQIMSTFKFTQ